MLGFDTKEETTSEAENIVNAGRPIVFHLKRRQMTLFEVTMGESY